MDARVGTGDSRSPATERVVGLVGGTGALGRGLAHRLSRAGHGVRVGSRDAARAAAIAQSLGPGVAGVTNRGACDADLVMVAVPWHGHDRALTSLRGALVGRLVVDCVNPLGFDEKGPYALPVDAGSATQRAQELLPESVVVGAFHHVSAELLAGDTTLDCDVLVVGDDRDAVGRVIEVVDTIAGLRGIHAGRLRNAAQVEALTANLIAINRRYRVQSGVRVSGLDL
jgi:NADPH-dependent F420 reductase